ncbi:ABC transporter permease [Desulfuromonas thiophila]|uniref:ABC transporter permease n=1 Tax=Desulfuromonas thiophila TaxID=57664 RepID=UPI003899216D
MLFMNLVRALWQYRQFVFGSVKREFQLKYRNSMLGAAWTLLQPLAMILVYALIFSRVMQARLPGVDGPFAYSIYLCAGILAWGMFAEILGRAQNIFLEQAGLIKKVNFPRMTLPLIVIFSALVNFLIVFGLFLVFLLVVGQFPGWVILSLFPVLFIQILVAIGLGMIAGVLNVFFRDVGQLIVIVLQFWFWLTPIVYPASILPASLRSLLAYNPMAGLIAAWQGVLVTAVAPQWFSLLYPALLGLVLCAFGFHLFRRRSAEMVDEL